MDQTTHDVRLANWKVIIDSCQARPDGQTAKEWLAENNVPEKQDYYWLRRIRQQSCQDLKPMVPAAAKAPATLAFAEFPAKDILPEDPDSTPAIVIRTKKSTIEISSKASDALAVRILKAVAHAL